MFYLQVVLYKFMLTQVAAEIAAPLTHTKKLTMVAIGDGEIGAAKLTNEIIQVMENLPKVVNNLTGVDFSKVTLKLSIYNSVICCVGQSVNVLFSQCINQSMCYSVSALISQCAIQSVH